MSKPRLIRKYANRRLYDTVHSRYVNLEDVRDIIVQGEDIEVMEQSTNRDITNLILLQIIGSLDRRSGSPLNPEFLMQLIRRVASQSSPLMTEHVEDAVHEALQRH